jgi:CDP-diacylglycerol--serine O-phosphatidyltransferase
LPITAAGCLVAASVLFLSYVDALTEARHSFFLVLIIALALLMVSNIRYRSFKDVELLKRKPFSTLVAAILGIVVVMAEPQIMIFCFSMAYLVAGVGNAAIQRYRKHGFALLTNKRESS